MIKGCLGLILGAVILVVGLWVWTHTAHPWGPCEWASTQDVAVLFGGSASNWRRVQETDKSAPFFIYGSPAHNAPPISGTVPSGGWMLAEDPAAGQQFTRLNSKSFPKTFSGSFLAVTCD